MGAVSGGFGCLIKAAGEGEQFLFRTYDVDLALDYPEVGCNYCVTYAFHGIAQSPFETYDVDNEAHTIKFKVKCNGTICTMRWRVTYEEKGSERGEMLVAQDVEVGFDESFDFDLPPHTADWRVEGKFFTGQPIICKKGDCGQFLEQGRITSIADGKTRLTLKLVNPFKAPTT